jgi:Zn finger protein HypA/HybF involved in hydrogenase expression
MTEDDFETRADFKEDPEVRKLIRNMTEEKKTKKEIEFRNYWYYIECEHCQTLFMVEDSIDSISPTERGKKVEYFIACCPRCRTENRHVSRNRIKLKYNGKADDDKSAPIYKL